jgi:predicted metal-binding membrane protein
MSPAQSRPVLLRFTPQAAALLLVASVAWVATFRLAVRMGNGPGTMGLGVAGFAGMWALMMAAMMLPSVAPVASLYARSVRSARLRRLAAFTGGYLAVWAAAGIPAYALLRATGALAAHHDTGARVVAVALLATAGVWELSGAKHRCLAHCRSPFSLLVHYGSYRGRLRDLRASVHHAGFCLGCCWALMVLLAVFGVMNIAAMVVLAVVVLLEKLWGRGTAFSRLVGVACLALALTAAIAPTLTPGLHQAPQMHMGG